MESQKWVAIQSFFEKNNLVSHQLSSFNNMIKNLPSIVSSYSKLTIPNKTVTTTVELSNFRIENPSYFESNGKKKNIYPTTCIQESLNYSGKMFIDATINVVASNGEVTSSKLVSKYIGDFPIMIFSEKCNLTQLSSKEDIAKIANHSIHDKGGYFISKGKEKIIIGQESSVSNKILVFKNKKQNSTYSPFFVEVRSYSTQLRRSSISQIEFVRDKLNIEIPYVSETQTIPVGILFKALGVLTEQEIFDLIFPPNTKIECIEKLQPTLEHSYSCKTQKDAIDFIFQQSKKKEKNDPDSDEDKNIAFIEKLLINEFLPHMNESNVDYSDNTKRKELFLQKAYFLGYMVARLIFTSCDLIHPDDRDHYINKRFSLAGTLLESQFIYALKRFITTIKKAGETTIEEGIIAKIESVFKPTQITNILGGCLTNNKWSGRQVDGVSQPMDRFNLSSYYVIARKSMIQIDINGKVFEPRKLNPSHWGVSDPSDTPEGKRIGLIHSMAMFARVTNYIDPTLIIKTIFEIPTFLSFEKRVNPKNLLNLVKVFVNGKWIGFSTGVSDIINKLKQQRRSGLIHHDTSIAIKLGEININTDGGRMIRPLFIVEKGRLTFTRNDALLLKNKKINWDDLLKTGKIEYIDKEEEDNTTTLVAMYPEDLEKLPIEEQYLYTHCELDPSCIYGVSGSKIPFSNHNQSPRISYQCSMGKQAIGLPSVNFKDTMDGNTIHVLNTIQRPIASTKMSFVSGLDELPAGQMAMVAICPFEGYNQEDSIVVNKASRDRGFMEITTYESYKTKLSPDRNEKFAQPTKECFGFFGNNSLVDEFGLIKPGTVLKKGDIIIGKISKNVEKAKKNEIEKPIVKFINNSIIYEHDIPATVDRVTCGIDGDGYEYVEVITAQLRPIGVGGEFESGGDKMSSRHGQKGTTGKVADTADLPFNENGDSADIFINPLAFPSRMTIAQLVECLCGKALLHGCILNDITTDDIEFYSSVNNDVFDASPFQKKFQIKDIVEMLTKSGINGFSDEVFYNGTTGEMMKSLIFYGPVYYQRLRHMVLGKYHSRSRGPRQTLTRQPREGRAQDGGYRLGWMEVCCLGANGVTNFIKDRLFDQSDRYKMWICRICGLPAVVSKDRTVKECRVCNTSQVALVDIPYGSKLLFQELGGMGINARILTTET